jgi:multidrug efflux pump
MMCAKLLTPQVQHNKFAYYSDRLLEKLEKYYQRLLKSVLATVAVPLWFAAIIALAVVPLFLTATKELAPSEDQGIVMSQLTVVPNASLAYTRLYADAIANQYLAMPEVSDVFQINGAGGLNTSIVGLRLKPWSMRHNTSHVLQLQLQRWLQKFSGVRGAVFEPAPLPGAGGLPVQFVIKTTDSFAILHELSQKLLDAARHSGLFIFLDSDLKIDKAQTALIVDRAKAADLGINMQNLGNNLSALFSQGYINYFNYDGRAYQVITQLHRSWRLNPQQLLSYYINSNSGKIVQLGTIAQLKSTVVPESLNHFQQLNAVTIVAQPVPGVSLSSALADLQSLAHKLLPVNYELDYAGQSRQFVQESGNFFAIFGFSLLLIFLCLAALFESFRDPLIILATVPLSLFAALIFINVGVGGATINIYTEVGLVTLVGIISKHGILIVQFANELQRKGKSKQAAIIAAAVVRLRPILMTTAAMVLGVFPLLTATGAGAASSFALGLVITAGISLGTLFTLFVVPAIYLVFAAKQHCIDTTLS